MNQERLQYQSYLLRLWQSERDGELTWHASLESPRTEMRINFGTLNELYTFLQERTEGGLSSNLKKSLKNNQP